MPSSLPVRATLHGKVAIVTGASRGIGAQVAFELAKRGAKVRDFTATLASASISILSTGSYNLYLAKQ